MDSGVRSNVLGGSSTPVLGLYVHSYLSEGEKSPTSINHVGVSSRTSTLLFVPSENRTPPTPPEFWTRDFEPSFAGGWGSVSTTTGSSERPSSPDFGVGGS